MTAAGPWSGPESRLQDPWGPSGAGPREKPDVECTSMQCEWRRTPTQKDLQLVSATPTQNKILGGERVRKQNVRAGFQK